MASSQDTLERLFQSLRHHGGKEAVCEFRHDAPRRRCTYQELADRSEASAQCFLHEGIARGERVGIMAKPSIEAITAALGVLRAGAVLMPIDSQLDSPTLQHIVSDGTPRLLCVDAEHRDRLTGLAGKRTPRLLTLDAIGEHFENSGTLSLLSPNDPAILFYTSGTSGPPKGVPLTNRNIAFELETIAKAHFLKDTDRLLLPLPLHHVYPLVIGLFVPLSMGLTVILPASVTGPELLEAIHDGDASVIIGVPRLYGALHEGIVRSVKDRGGMTATGGAALLWLLTRLRRHFGIRAGKLLLRSLHKRLGPRLRVLANGGAALDRNLFVGLEALGWKTAIGYGLTETSPILTLSVPGKSRPASAGLVAKGVELRIDTSAAPEGAPKGLGEVLARGPNVFGGYRNLEGMTAAAFTGDGWFRTGDLGYFGRGGHLYLLDRLSTVIVTGSGENVQPDEVEAVYEQHPSIREIGVLQHEGKLVAVIVPQAAAIAAEGLGVEEGVRVAVGTQSRLLPSYKRITGYAVTRQEIPRTRLGKIRRPLLPEHYRQAQEAGRKATMKPLSLDKMSESDRALLGNPAALKVWEILSHRFPNRSLTPDTQPRFDLGVDSLGWLELTLEIRSRTGVEIDEQAVASIDTVRDLLRQTAEQSQRGAPVRADPFDHPEEALKPEQRRWLEPLTVLQRISRLGLYLVNRAVLRAYFRLSVDGLDNLRRAGQCIIAPNHVSYIDSFVLGAAIPYGILLRTAWAAGVEVAFRNRLNQCVSRLAGALPIEHGMGARSDMALAAAAIDRKKSIIWYPEGRRATDTTGLHFRPGIGLLLQRKPLPVVPALIQGTDRAMPIGTAIPRPAHVRVTFGEARSIDDLRGKYNGDEAADRQRIVDALRAAFEELRSNAGSGSPTRKA